MVATCCVQKTTTISSASTVIIDNDNSNCSNNNYSSMHNCRRKMHKEGNGAVCFNGKLNTSVSRTHPICAILLYDITAIREKNK